MEANWNYMELICSNEDGSIDVGKKKFSQMFNSCHEKYKCFEKNISRYFYDDLIYEICNQEVKVFNKQPIHCNNENGITKTKYIKDKKPYYMFGSTQKINNMQNVSSAIFRLHNNVYLNFEIIEFPHLDKFIYKVYLNYNHDDINDMDHIQKKVNDFLKNVMINCEFNLASNS